MKHIDFDYFEKWLNARKQQIEKKLFVVSEYWLDNIGNLEHYMEWIGYDYLNHPDVIGWTTV